MTKILKYRQFLEEAGAWHPKYGESKTLLHHISDKSFSSFRPLSHFGTVRASRARTASSENYIHTKQFYHYSVRIKPGNTVHIGDIEDDHHPSHIVNALHHAGHITDEEHETTHHQLSRTSSDIGKERVLTSLLQRKNIDTLSYTNSLEHPGSKSYITVNPKNIRIVNKKRVSSENINKKKAENDYNMGGTQNKSIKFVLHHGTPLLYHPNSKKHQEVTEQFLLGRKMKTFKTFIQESWSEDKFGTDRHISTQHGKRVKIIFDPMKRGNKEHMHMNFTIGDKDSMGDNEVHNLSQSQRMDILSHVHKKIDEYIKTRKPKSIEFVSNSDKKTPIYDRMAQRIAKKHNGTPTTPNINTWKIHFKDVK